MLARHPPADLPTWDDSLPPQLVVNREAVMLALGSFPRGSSPGGSKLRAQHLVDAMTGTTVPAALECQENAIVNGNFIVKSPIGQ